MGGVLTGLSVNGFNGKSGQGITLAELKVHNNKDNLWVKIGEKVYDLTKFQKQHPGGVGTLLAVAGQDATVQFNKAGHSQNAVTSAAIFCVGDFVQPKTKEEKLLMKLLEEKEKEVEILKKKVGGDSKTIYEQLGGKAAMDAFIPIFYKYNLSDDRIKHFFARTDMLKLFERQKSYLSFIFGSPEPYFGKDMATAHVGMYLNDNDFNAVVDNAAKTLTDLGVSQDLIAKCAAVLEKDREACLHK